MKSKFFELAKKLSAKSDHPKHQLGVVIVKKDRVLSLGINKYKTHPRSTHPYRFLHAEMDAIISAKEDLKNSNAYIYRQTKDGKLGLARPCIHCLKALKEAGIKKIYFTTYTGYFSEYL